MIASAFGALLAPIVNLFHQVLTQIIALTKKSLQKYGFLALSAYESLLSLQHHWDDLFSRRSVDSTSEKNELKDGLQNLRGLCLRSFPEFLADIKLASTSRGSDTNTRLTDFTVSVRFFLNHNNFAFSDAGCVQAVEYIKRVPRVQSAVEAALHALGDGNWKMGEGIQVGRGTKVDDGSIMEHFFREFSISPNTQYRR